MTEQTLVDGKTAAEHRDEASRAHEAREESWQRSDTDGFLSQWAHGITAQLASAKAEIAENGGKASFLVLFDGNDSLVPSRTLNTKFGVRRVTVDESGTFDVWMNTSPKAANKKGFKLVWVEHCATAITEGSGRGLSGNVWIARKAICEKCETFVQVIGMPCKCGHTTGFDVGDEYTVESERRSVYGEGEGGEG